MDWSELFGLSVSPWELIVRGSAMYLFLFLLFRVVIKRRMGAVGMADILILVIVADAAQNGMSGQYQSITEGFILVATLIAWNALIDWLVFAVPPLQRILEPPPLLIIDNGRVLHRNLRIEFMSQADLDTKLREHGVTDPGQVAKARSPRPTWSPTGARRPGHRPQEKSPRALIIFAVMDCRVRQ